MHYCRICRTEKNLKYTLKELRKFSRRRCHDRLVDATPTLGNICHDCEERLHNFHRLDEHEDGDDNEGRIIVDDDELLYNLFFRKVEQQRLMKRLIAVGGGDEWHTQSLRQQTLVASTASVTVNAMDEVIEVLTSRENTPSPAPKVPNAKMKTPANKGMLTSNAGVNICEGATSDTIAASTETTATTTIEKCSPYKVVAIIDLEDEESTTTSVKSGLEALLTPQTALDTDEEEIIFRKVDPEQDLKLGKQTKSKNKFRKGKHSYANRDMHLIASLSLVSSDNDSDIGVTEHNQKKLNYTPNHGDKEKTEITVSSSLNDCPPKVSVKSGLDEVQQQECLDAGVPCPVCNTEFTSSQRLIHHMRLKHRSYDGDVLSERPRCAQDSAMTIRLRYMQRYTYYECQLCGSIDAVFKIHKEHVMQQHAEESKSLKDPMMQKLKCPVCKEKCGTQYVELLRHMLHAHKATDCRAHFRQVTHIQKVFSSCGPSKQKELRRTARVYQVTKRKQYFFECNQCQKIVTGYFNHLKHQSTHNVVNAVINTPVPKPLPALTKLHHNHSEIKDKYENSKVAASKEACVKRKLSQVKQQFHQQLPSQQKSVQPQVRQQQRERKQTKKATQDALVKVKVKQQFKQLPAQRYKCKLCIESFKGFHQLNLHMLRVHARSDHHLRCDICLLRFVTTTMLDEHVQRHHANKQKRKISSLCNVSNRQPLPERKQSTHEAYFDADYYTDGRKRIRQCIKSSLNGQKSSALTIEKRQEKWTKEENLDIEAARAMDTLWLRDLVALAQRQPKNSNTAKNNDKCHDKTQVGQSSPTLPHFLFASQQCLYCAHLYGSTVELHAHELLHSERRDAKIIRRCQINAFTSRSVLNQVRNNTSMTPVDKCTQNLLVK